MANGFYVFGLILLSSQVQKSSSLSCFVCGESNLPSPGECTKQYQYDCNTADPNQQSPPIRGPKMICRTSRSKLTENTYSVGKECVSEDEHFQRYPEGKAFGCETAFPNTTHEVSYCICDNDYCNGKSIDEQIQQFRVFYEPHASGGQNGGQPIAINVQPAAPVPVQLPTASENIAVLSRQQQQQFPAPVQQAEQIIIPAPAPNRPGGNVGSPDQRSFNNNVVISNNGEFGRTPPGVDQQQQQQNLPFQNGADINGNPLILTPPLILPNNSLLLPPYPASSSSAPQRSIQLFTQSTRQENNNAPFLPAPKQHEVDAVRSKLPMFNGSLTSNVPFTTFGEQQPLVEQQPQQEPVFTLNQQQQQQAPTQQDFNLTNLNTNQQQSRHDQTPDDLQPEESKSRWPILTLENHVVAQPNQQDSNTKLICGACSENNVSLGVDCPKQLSVDCSSALPIKSRLFCFTKDILYKTGTHTIERRCASEDILKRELGLSNIHDSCGQTRPESPTEFRYCICSTNACNEKPMQQQLILYTSPPHQQGVQSENPWFQHQQQQLAGGIRQPTGTSEVTITANSPTISAENDSKVNCYICGESDLQHATDCGQQYEYDCRKQYPANSNAKILCLTRQTKLANGLFSIEKRCIAESEHKQQYPGSARVATDGCGEAWNGYVQYCVCDADNQLCNGPNITLQQKAAGHTPTDITLQQKPGAVEDGTLQQQKSADHFFNTTENRGLKQTTLTTARISSSTTNLHKIKGEDPFNVGVTKIGGSKTTTTIGLEITEDVKDKKLTNQRKANDVIDKTATNSERQNASEEELIQNNNNKNGNSNGKGSKINFSVYYFAFTVAVLLSVFAL